MKITFKNIFSVFKNAAQEWIAKDPFRESAIIAYYSIFALPGLLIVIITLAGLFFGSDAVNNHLASQITSVTGERTALQIQKMIAAAGESKNSGWATVIATVTIIFGATGVFAQFQKSLNIIWEVKADPSKSGILRIVRVRLFSFGVIIAIAFMLIVSLVISALLAAFGNWLSANFSSTYLTALQIINFLLSLVILSVLFALLFKYFPDAKVKWRHVWIGSFVSACLFEIGKFGLGLFFGKVNPATGYGAAGSVILILLWASYSSMIVFYGAEFTRAYTILLDGTIPPDKNAVKRKKVKE
jgi:membrane protein